MSFKDKINGDLIIAQNRKDDLPGIIREFDNNVLWNGAQLSEDNIQETAMDMVKHRTGGHFTYEELITIGYEVWEQVL